MSCLSQIDAEHRLSRRRALRKGISTTIESSLDEQEYKT
jgi:hypothetical protein